MSVIALLLGLGLQACASAPQGPGNYNGVLRDAEYRIQPGDTVLAREPFNPQYDATAVVAPDGRIVMPGLRTPIEVGGSTVPELSARMEQAYASAGLLKQPAFAISLASLGNQQVYVGGEVVRPGAVSLARGPRNAMQVLMASGGPLSTASLADAAVFRVAPDGATQVIPLDLAAVLHGTALSQNIPLRAQDVLIVPRSGVANFDRAMDQYVRKAMPIPFNILFELTNAPTVLR